MNPSLSEIVKAVLGTRMKMIGCNCPICGYTPEVTSVSLDKGNGHGYPGHFEYYIHCSNNECPLVRKVPMFTVDDIYRSKEQVHLQLCEKWNVEAAKIEKLIANKGDKNGTKRKKANCNRNHRQKPRDPA